MLFDPETFEVTAILDWEWSHAGDPLDDLAWCEWIVRTHHPADVGALDSLFAGYGSRPPWAHRQERRLARCRQLVQAVPPDEAAVRLWQNRLDATAGWQEE
jgi:aminoglycoside phosphotransferase (APT) family kinase protein